MLPLTVTGPEMVLAEHPAVPSPITTEPLLLVASMGP